MLSVSVVFAGTRDCSITRSSLMLAINLEVVFFGFLFGCELIEVRLEFGAAFIKGNRVPEDFYSGVGLGEGEGTREESDGGNCVPYTDEFNVYVHRERSFLFTYTRKRVISITKETARQIYTYELSTLLVTCSSMELQEAVWEKHRRQLSCSSASKPTIQCNTCLPRCPV